MPLYHNDDQAMLKDSVAPFVAEQAPVSHLRKLRDEADATGFSRDLWAQFTEMGLPGMLVPEAHGGLGMGHMEAGIVLEEIGRHCRYSFSEIARRSKNWRHVPLSIMRSLRSLALGVQ